LRVLYLWYLRCFHELLAHILSLFALVCVVCGSNSSPNNELEQLRQKIKDDTKQLLDEFFEKQLLKNEKINSELNTIA